MMTNNLYKVKAKDYYYITNEESHIVAEKIRQMDKRFGVNCGIESKSLRTHPVISLGKFVYQFKAFSDRWDLEFIINMRQDYYEGAILDWEMRIYSFSGVYNNLEGFFRDIQKAIEKGEMEGWDKRRWILHKDKEEKEVKETIQKWIDHIEDILSKVANKILIRVTTLDNGEIVYKVINKCPQKP